MESAHDEINAMAQAWIDRGKATLFGSDNDDADINDLFLVIEQNPTKAWAVVKCIARGLRDGIYRVDPGSLESFIGLLGAGDFENLVEDHHRVLINEIESESSINPIMKRVIRSMWQGKIPDPVWIRLQAAAR